VAAKHGSRRGFRTAFFQSIVFCPEHEAKTSSTSLFAKKVGKKEKQSVSRLDFRRIGDKLITPDYRIICTEYALPGEGWHTWDNHIEYACRTKIEDVCAVANSLGFLAGEIQLPETRGKRGAVYMADEKTVLFAFRCYLNRNVHIKFNIELMKALNVAVARKLGWIRKPSDLAQEFPPEMAKGAERYFDCFRLLDISNAQKLICAQPETIDDNDCSGEEQEEISLPLSV
jgi:hypothetical protein